ncbi:ComF family protein [Candidatus Gracilibacteria bacterium]|nr:ComF family protein [Candidatus Gracilibacteria bacterium]
MLKSEHYKRSIPGFTLDKVVVGELYSDEMRRRIHRFKFVHNYVDNVYFRELLASIKEEYPFRPDYIVYPPVSLRDRIFRGPNHAKLLVSYFQPGDIPALCPFQKKIFSSHQSRRTKAERSSVREEYSLSPKYREQIKGKKILLIDDLITTGWTAHTLGKLLKKAGAKEVVGFFLSSEKV